MSNIKRIMLILLSIYITLTVFASGTYAAASYEVKWLTNRNYSAVYEFENGLAQVSNGSYSMAGFINTDGKEIIPIGYYSDYLTVFSGKLSRIYGEYNWQGLVNTETGEFKQPIEYSWIGSLSEGLARIAKDTKFMYGETKWGYIDEDGEIALPIVYDQAHDFKDSMALVEKDGEWYYIDKSGNKVMTISSHDYENMGDFHNGAAWVKENGKYGYIDESGNEITPLEYDFAEDFSGDYAVVQKFVSGRGYVNGVVDKTGKTVIPLIYDGITILDNNRFKVSVYSIELGHFRSSILGEDGHVIIPFVDSQLNFNDGVCVIRENNKYGYIDEKGDIIIPTNYDDASDFKDGMAIVKKGDKAAVIDKNGNAVIPFKYNLIRRRDKEGLFEVGTGDDYYGYKLGLVDKKGNVLAPLIYDSISDFNDGLARVIIIGENADKSGADRNGYIDKNGKVVIPLIYDRAVEFREGVASVKKGGKFGYVDKTGKLVVPIIFDYAADYSSDGVLIVRQGDKWGLIKNPVKSTPKPTYIQALPTSSKVVLDSRNISFDAYNINGNNYFKLRDLAAALNGTEKQFEVIWNSDKKAINLISNTPYTTVGGEMAAGDGKAKSATLNNSAIYKDGMKITLTAYTINGNNYFKLRDIGKAFNFSVLWDGKTNTILIDTAKAYE